MEVFYSIGIWLIIGLGVLGALVGLLIFFSCRCVPGWKPAASLMNNETYKKFFKKHCNMWWLFWAIVIVHMAVALVYLFGP